MGFDIERAALLRSGQKLALSAVAMAFVACASEPNLDDRTGQQLVVTKYDPAVDFGTFSTFAVAPTVSQVSDVGDGRALGASESQAVVDRIAENLAARGYVRVDPGARPELGVSASVLLQIKVATAVSAGSFWGAPGYTATPAYWGYPSGSYGAPWGYSSTAYKSGTLTIDMVDLRDVAAFSAGDAGGAGDAGLRLEMAWVGIAHGYASLAGSLAPEALPAIDQAFIQSPYLRKR